MEKRNKINGIEVVVHSNKVSCIKEFDSIKKKTNDFDVSICHKLRYRVWMEYIIRLIWYYGVDSCLTSSLLGTLISKYISEAMYSHVGLNRFLKNLSVCIFISGWHICHMVIISFKANSKQFIYHIISLIFIKTMWENICCQNMLQIKCQYIFWIFLLNDSNSI